MIEGWRTMIGDRREELSGESNERGSAKTELGAETADEQTERSSRRDGVGSPDAPTPSFQVERFEWVERSAISGSDLSLILELSGRIPYTSSNTRHEMYRKDGPSVHYGSGYC